MCRSSPSTDQRNHQGRSPLETPQKAQHLTDDMVAKRKQRAQQFKEKIEGDQLEFILTLDECTLPLDYTNGETEHYYAPKNIEERDRPAPLATATQQFPEQHNKFAVNL